eukprot:1144109-Pelagomonas_calceolata.AAC.3
MTEKVVWASLSLQPLKLQRIQGTPGTRAFNFLGERMHSCASVTGRVHLACCGPEGAGGHLLNSNHPVHPRSSPQVFVCATQEEVVVATCPRTST